MKKILKIIGLCVIAILVVLFIIGLFAGNDQPTESGDIKVTVGNDDPNKVLSIGDTLTNLFLHYRDAQLHTNALLLIDPAKTTPEAYKEFGASVVDDWVKVDEDAYGVSLQQNALQDFFSIQKAFAASDPLTPPSPTIPFQSSDFKSINLSPSGNSEVNITPTVWDNVNAVKSMVPKASTLSMVQNLFSTTARDAQKIVEDHYTAEANNFNNAAEWNKKAANTATAINTASKVGLFIGGAVITAGGTAVLTGPAGAAIATGFGSNVGIVGGTVIAANGVGVVLDVGKNSAALGFATEETAAIYAKASDKYQPVSDVLAIAGLKSGMEDPGNLYTIYDFGARGYDYISMNFGASSTTINVKTYKNPPQFTAITAEGLFASALPSDFQYITLNYPQTKNTPVNVNNNTSQTPVGNVLSKETFSAGMGDWYEESWFKKQSSGGEVTFDGKGASFHGVGNSRSGIMLDMNKDVSGYQNLTLTATVIVENQELSGTGWQGREAPAAVAVSYIDVDGNNHNQLDINEGGPNQMFWRGFYYLDPNDDQAQTTRGIKVTRNQPYRYSFDLMKLDPKPKIINFIALEGAGWGGRRASVSEISINGTK